jgi:hypothetical protein
LIHETATHTISLILTLDPDLDVRLEQQQTFCAIHLSAARHAAYRFILYVYDDGESQVGVTLVDGDPEAYFWYWPFEESDYGSQSEREQAFLKAVRELLTSRTRIRRKRGLLNTHFRCEVLRASGWSRVGPFMAGLRWGTKPPPTESRAVYYESPALIEP